MRKNIFMLSGILGLLFVFTLTSCKKDDDDQNTGGGGGVPLTSVSTLTATINGVAWTNSSNGFNSMLVLNACPLSYGAWEGGRYSITLDIYDQVSVGSTYDFGLTSGNATAVLTITDTITGVEFTTDDLNGNGQLTITEFNSTTRSVSGTFSCTAFDAQSNSTISITNASFKDRPYFGSFPGNIFNAQWNGLPLTPCDDFSYNDLGDSLINIEALYNGGEEIGVLAFPNNVATGATLDLSDGIAFVFVINGSIISESSATSATVQINSHNKTTKRISGTFSLTAVDLISGSTITITNGQFQQTYQDFYVPARNPDAEKTPIRQRLTDRFKGSR